MSSHFNPSPLRSRKPSVCRAGLFPLPIAYVAGRPTTLAAFCRWYDPAAGYDIAESFRLTKDHALPGWSGASADFGLNLKVEVTILEAKHRYDLHLTIRSGTTRIDDDSWHDVPIPEGPPFDSRILTHTYEDPIGLTQIHVLD